MKEFNKAEARSYFNKYGFIFLVGSILVIGLQYAASFWLKWAKPEWASNGNISLIVCMLPVFCIGYPAFIALLNLLPKAEPIQKNKMKVSQFIIAFIMCYGLVYAGNIVGVIIVSLFSKVFGVESQFVVANLVTGTNTWVQIVIMVILAPIFEELIFRKLLVDKAIRYGEPVAILLSAILFCLFHGNFSQGIYAFLMGAFFAYIYIRTGKIRYTICFHMLINFVGSVVAGKLLELIKYNELMEKLSAGDMNAYMNFIMENLVGYIIYISYVGLILIISIVGIILLIVFRKRFFLLHHETDIPKGEKFKTVFLNPGMIITVLVWVVFYVLSIFGK